MIVDDDGEYIAGTMRCFAGVALAGLFAASSLAAQLPGARGWHQDSPSQALEDTHVIPWVQPAQPGAWTAVFRDDSDFAPGAVSVALDEGQWTVTVPPPVVSVRPVTNDDQFVSAVSALDHSDWSVYVPPQVGRVTPVTDDDQFVIAPTFFVERYEWPVVVGPPIVPRIVQAVTDDDQYIGYLGTDEDGWLAPVPAKAPSVVALTDDDQYVTPAATFFVERYQWPLYTPPITTTGPVVAVTDDDQYVSLAASFFVERYQWPLYAAPSTTARVVAVTDDDQFVGPQPFVLVQGSVGSGAWIPFARARSLKITQRDILRATKRRRVPVVVVETPAIVALAPPLVGRAWETAPAPVVQPRLVPTPLGLRLNTASPAFGSGTQHAVAAPAPVDPLVALHESDDDLIHAIALLL